MSFHDIKETTRISPASTADQTTNPLFSELLKAGLAGMKSPSLRDQSALGELRSDGTMLLGVVPLTGDWATIEQGRQIRRGPSDSSSSPGRSTHEQIVNTISAAKDALRSKQHKSDASSVDLQRSISAIGKILSDLPRSSQSEGSVVSSIRAIIQETAKKNIAPPPRPK